jgi:hypothetical protein
MNTGLHRQNTGVDALLDWAMRMGSGLAALRRPGMTGFGGW